MAAIVYCPRCRAGVHPNDKQCWDCGYVLPDGHEWDHVTWTYRY